LLENEDWSNLQMLSQSSSIPAKNWQQVTGDAVSGYGLLESRPGIAFRVDDLTEDQTLALLAESLELLELRDPRRDFRATAWQYTFTTSMQEQDNPADFRWRCLHSDNPASSRFAGPDCRPLSEIRSQRVTSEESVFASLGRQPPRFVTQPQNGRGVEEGSVRLVAKAEGVPIPAYQWFSVDRAGNGQPIANGSGAELLLQNPPVGISRYVVRASNSQGSVTSELAELAVERKLRLSTSRSPSATTSAAKPELPGYVKSAEDIERQRRRIEADQTADRLEKGLRRRKVFASIGAVLLIAAVTGLVWWKESAQQTRAASVPKEAVTNSQTVAVSTTTSVVPETATTNLQTDQRVPAPPIRPPPKSTPDEAVEEKNHTLQDTFTNIPAPKKPSANLPAKK
jgi:hypothetical protein